MLEPKGDEGKVLKTGTHHLNLFPYTVDFFPSHNTTLAARDTLYSEAVTKLMEFNDGYLTLLLGGYSD